MKSISKLHYITQDIADKPHWLLAEEACVAGLKWIQLRLKNKSAEEIKAIALKTLDVCRKYNCKLILNDHVSIAVDCGVDGIHLGKNDMDVSTARDIVGMQMIIGGTSNTFEDIQILNSKGVDYIGLGPYRFTTTKEKLSPVLGMQGYHDVLTRCAANNITTPVIAIGGIETSDVTSLLPTGIYGVAVASAIGLSNDKTKTVADFHKLINIKGYELKTWR